MTEELFRDLLEVKASLLDEIRLTAHRLHDDVNQKYGTELPYSYHLDMVADMAKEFGYMVLEKDEDILPLLFGAYFHDSIEDARQSYNDIVRTASRFMDEKRAVVAAEIVYALTNEKGRTRHERAGEKYYRGIRTTAYAPFVKMCDRLANTRFSASGSKDGKPWMRSVYAKEYPGFIDAITSEADDIRYSVPQQMKDLMESILTSTDN